MTKIKELEKKYKSRFEFLNNIKNIINEAENVDFVGFLDTKGYKEDDFVGILCRTEGDALTKDEQEEEMKEEIKKMKDELISNYPSKDISGENSSGEDEIVEKLMKIITGEADYTITYGDIEENIKEVVDEIEFDFQDFFESDDIICHFSIAGFDDEFKEVFFVILVAFEYKNIQVLENLMDLIMANCDEFSENMIPS